MSPGVITRLRSQLLEVGGDLGVGVHRVGWVWGNDTGHRLSVFRLSALLKCISLTFFAIYNNNNK